MNFRYSIVPLLAVPLFSMAAMAQDSVSFGLADEVLAQRFYDEALAIAQSELTEEEKLFADIENSGASNGQAGNIGADLGFGVLREAYRADPEATLDLIRRIMEAGGKN